MALARSLSGTSRPRTVPALFPAHSMPADLLSEHHRTCEPLRFTTSCMHLAGAIIQYILLACMGADLMKQCSRHVSPQSPHLDRQELLPSGRLVRQDNQCCGSADLVVCFVDESWEIRKELCFRVAG